MELTNHKVESFVRGSIIYACTERYLSKIQHILVPKARRFFWPRGHRLETRWALELAIARCQKFLTSGWGCAEVIKLMSLHMLLTDFWVPLGGKFSSLSSPQSGFFQISSENYRDDTETEFSSLNFNSLIISLGPRTRILPRRCY